MVVMVIAPVVVVIRLCVSRGGKEGDESK
jgi:hypothetical protein